MMETAIGTQLIPHPQTGEVLDLATATDQQLVDLIEAIESAGEQLKNFRAHASTEMVERLDRSGEWTRRVDVRGTVYEIKAPSPTAGTESYNKDQLIQAVKDLQAEGVIDPSAVARTVQHIVTVTFVVPEGEADRIVAEAQKDERLPRVERETKIAKSGVNALLKVPGAKERVEACMDTSEPKSAAERRVSVKPKA